MNLLIIPSWYDTPDNPIRGIFFKEQAQALSEYFKKNNIEATVTILALQQYNIREKHLYKGIKKITITEENGIKTIRARLFHIPKARHKNDSDPSRQGAIIYKADIRHCFLQVLPAAFRYGPHKFRNPLFLSRLLISPAVQQPKSAH